MFLEIERHNEEPHPRSGIYKLVVFPNIKKYYLEWNQTEIQLTAILAEYKEMYQLGAIRKKTSGIQRKKSIDKNPDP